MAYTKKQLKALHDSAIKKAWERERALVMFGIGTRDWTVSQQQELIRSGKVQGFDGQHMKSSADYNEYAGDSRNIQFLTYEEHIWGAHESNTRRNLTNGYYDPATGVMHEFDGSELKAPPLVRLTDKYDFTQEQYAQLGPAFGYDRGETIKASRARFKERSTAEKQQSHTNTAQEMPADNVSEDEGQTMYNKFRPISAGQQYQQADLYETPANADPRLYAQLGLSHDQVAAINDPYANDIGSYVYVKSLNSNTKHTPSLHDRYGEALSGYKEQYPDRFTNEDSYNAYMSEVKSLQENMGYYPDLDTRVQQNYYNLVSDGVNPYVAMDELGAYPYMYAGPQENENVSEDLNYDPYGQSEDNSEALGQSEDLSYDPYGQSEDNSETLGQSENLSYDPYAQSEDNSETFEQGENYDYDPYAQSEDNIETLGQGENYDYDPYAGSESSDVSTGSSESEDESCSEEASQSY